MRVAVLDGGFGLNGAEVDVDLLVMSTVARRPPRIPAADDPQGQLDAAGYLGNNAASTGQFDNSG